MRDLRGIKLALLAKWRQQGIAESVLQAFEAVPREAFIPLDLRENSYDDRPLPVGHKQTISQPTTIVQMLSLLDPSPKMSVLEIGSGTGYVCALLAEMRCDVTGLEIIPELSVGATRVLTELGYGGSVRMYTTDGGKGWEQDGPYDRILISAAFPESPEHLFPQLKEKGVMVAPVGSVSQQMMRFIRKGDDIIQEEHGEYVFVPLTGERGIERPDLPHLPFV